MDEAADNFDLATIEPCLNEAEEATDESLVATICAGDESAFERLFERHRRRVARIISRFFNRPERVEEIVQEVFTKVYFALDNYSSGRGTSFAAWLSRITINACYDELRRARRRPESSISDITDDEVMWLNARMHVETAGGDAESVAVSRDLANKLLARLGAEDRLVLTLLDGEGLPVSDLAELTGWSISKVKVRAHRARAALRRVLADFL
ncbi:MAG TPA: sigma-70 family RNA polymerase sigma factor [Blastocatellia bacterium]|jgi:RNA polymerase sigma-70 factor (ECF subfamily)